MASQQTFLDQCHQVQRERLAYIEFRLYFLGTIRRRDLVERFGTSVAAATRDFALYKQLAAGNIAFDSKVRAYTITDTFSPIFSHDAERVLSMIAKGFGAGISPVTGSLVECAMPVALNRPSLATLAPVTRAIAGAKVVRMQYWSHSSGLSQRNIVPFALANDGLRWHVRAFDRKSQAFRDFVFTRMEQTEVIDEALQAHEVFAQDQQWQHIVELELVPHPERPNLGITTRDYGMTEGVLRLNVRAALAGYVLRHWHVDCSPHHGLRDLAYRLWLRNESVLLGVATAPLAPGYQQRIQ